MKVTREVIRDLLPAYFAGEASEDTRSLVEEYFRQDPGFERTARQGAQQLEPLGRVAALTTDQAHEKSALSRVHKALRYQRMLFGIALTFTLNAILIGLSFEIVVDGETRVTHMHWFQFAFQRELSLGLAAAAIVLWTVYFLRAWRSRANKF